MATGIMIDSDPILKRQVCSSLVAFTVEDNSTICGDKRYI